MAFLTEQRRRSQQREFRMGKNKEQSEPNLKGTLVNVLGIGIITAAIWLVFRS